jgi:hypothetical protein
MRYKKTLILWFLMLPLVIIQLFILPNVPGFTNIYIIDTIGGFIVFTYLFIIIASVIGGLLAGYLFGPLFLFVHKKIIGRKMEYGLQDKDQIGEFKAIKKGFFPGFFAMSIGLDLMINPVIQDIVLKSSFAGGDMLSQLITFFALLPIMIGIGTGLFSPVWFLLDAGIVYSNKNKVKGTSYPTEVKSVGGWYMYLLKGYAGITVIITFYTFISQIIASLITPYSDIISTTIIILLMPVVPVFIALMAVPGFIALDKTYDHRKNYIRTVAKKFGISEPLVNPLELIRKGD